MALTADDTARLASLKAARDAIIAGKKANKVQSGGRLVEYGPGDVGQLDAAIDMLEAAASSTGPIRRRGALRFRVR